MKSLKKVISHPHRGWLKGVSPYFLPVKSFTIVFTGAAS